MLTNYWKFTPLNVIDKPNRILAEENNGHICLDARRDNEKIRWIILGELSPCKSCTHDMHKAIGNFAGQLYLAHDGPLSAQVKKALIASNVFAVDAEKFFIESPLHSSVPRHSFADPAEIEKFCAAHKTTKYNFPRIFQDDTQAVWLRAMPGDVIRVDRTSQLGPSIVYRICIPKCSSLE